MSIIATVTICRQVSVDSYRDHHISREFEEDRSIDDVISWAKTMVGREYISICDIQFSEMTGKSL